MANYIVPSIGTLDEYNLWPFVGRALGLIYAVKLISPNVWSVHGHIVRWDGAGFVCDCEDWERHHVEQGGWCKHSIAVALQSSSYRERIVAAMEERKVAHV